MTRVQALEEEIARLSTEEIEELSDWLAEFRAKEWDDQIEADAQAGKFNDLARQALAEARAGNLNTLN